MRGGEATLIAGKRKKTVIPAMAASLTGMKTMAMEGSSSEESYEKHSGFQNQNFRQVGKPLLEKAVEQLLCNIAARGAESAYGRKHVAIADFGCSYGRNTLDCAEVILGALQRSCADRLQCSNKMPEIHYFFADLPSNDFYSLFQSLHPYLHHPPPCNGVAPAPSLDLDLPKIFAAGVPGSFHGRLLPTASLDLAICTYSLHWLSQVPPSVLDKSSPAWNGGRVWIRNAPQGVVDAYISQSHIDVTNFLKSRAQELASGGILFLLLGIPAKESNIGSVENAQVCRWEILNCAWKELVKEGIITVEDFDTFNLPIYFLNEHELKDMLKGVPEFKMLHLETIEESDNNTRLSLDLWPKTIISSTKPTVETHLGKEKSKELFKRLNNLVSKNHGLVVANKILVASLQRL